ncbi:hypothetical protein C8F04DRAFT_1113686 [Mycena alexandri]|uniref:FHA domain-containing protein n=1 Tax=Mycena alexandri TaxID=1745969 RepID=A0AAD6X347_9AGAR|nr:hypothetical protein C8F04DRAFT_1113686 [Mycena alexandri]
MDTPGRFGTVQLLRRQPASNSTTATTTGATGGEEVVVASFGVDTPTVSFGRDPTCSVRLYYPAVAPLHARIVFSGDESEKKKNAFVEVLGANGMLVDGCMVYPNAQDDGSGSGSAKGVRTIALGNGSELEIHGKRFRFVYPPKEMRKALAASPARPANRALRLSLIPSAQVFDPRPSPDPRQNLRVLQSPLRIAGSSPKKNGSPAPGTPSPSPRGVQAGVQTQQDDEEEADAEDGQTITLVQGSHPRVVEEAKDLVILEDVELSAQERAAAANNQSPTATMAGAGRGRSNSTSAGSVAPPSPPPPAPPRTPRRQSLHRAVLIRSAQRAVWAANSPASNNSGSNSGSNSSTPSAGSSNSSAGSVLRGWQAPAAAPSTSPTRATVSISRAAEEQEDEADDETDTEEEEAEVRRLGLEVVSVSSGSESEDDEDDDDDDANNNEKSAPQPRLGWRKSLERIALWPFGGRVKTEEEETALPPASAEDEDHEKDEHEENEGNDDQQNEGYEDDDDDNEMDMQIQTPRTGTPRTPMLRQTPAAAPALAAARSPTKTPAAVPRSPTKTPFGAPHPAARTPRGFGRKSIPSAEAAKPYGQEEADVPMDVDAEGYTPLYEDLASYRLGNAPTITVAERTIKEQDAARAKASTPPPIRARPLAAFMTPQAPRAGFAAYGVGGAVPGSAKPAGGAPRYSLGGAARRVLVQDQPWKVNDLLVSGTPSTSNGPGTPARGVPARPAVSAEERRVISERRRSALKMPDPFFAGGIPGMSPAKKKVGVPGLGLGRVQEGTATVNSERDAEGSASGSGKQDDRTMLESLRETVEGLRRRRESVLADAGIMVEENADETGGEGKVEFRPEVEKPKSRMLRGRPREEARSEVEESASDHPENEMSTTKTAEVNGMDIDAPSKSPRRGRKAAPTRAVEESEDEMAVDPAPAPKPARRSRKPTAEPETEKELSVPAATRRTRKATPTPTTEDDEQVEKAVDPAPVKARRTRKPTAEPEVANDEPAAIADVPAAPTKSRRGRKATTEPESDDEPAPALARRARKPPSTDARTPATVPATEPAAPPKRRGRAAKAATPASAPERKTRGRSRAPEETQTEVEDDADPLDTITDTPDVEIVAVVPKTRRSRSAKPKAVKEEEAEPVLEGTGTAVPPRAGRTKKTVPTPPVPAVPAAPKPRSTRKGVVPASAPAVVEVGEKENAPDEEREESEPVAKVRVSRSRKVKEEAVDSDSSAPAPRRATRARTRTG